MKKLRSLLFICLLVILSIGSAFSSDKKPLNETSAKGDSELQQGPVNGSVTDAATGEPLLGVTVVVKGTTIGQITNLQGEFTINVPQNESLLVFSFVGYATQELMVNPGATVSVQMQVEALEMGEVVIVGYGVQKKESVVAAISQTTGEEILQSMQGGDLTNALKGNLNGLVTVQFSGIPGGSSDDNPATQIFIRGKKTWNDAAPLVLVDGIERNMNDIDPYTIERISILKDASATAVFGVKGANGVLLITTIRGQEGKPKLSFNASTTAKGWPRIPSLVDSYNALLVRNYLVLNEVATNEASWGFMTPQRILDYYKDGTYPDYLVNESWSEDFVRDFTMDKNINMNVGGGTKFVKYFGSLSYYNEGDVLKIEEQGQGYNPSFNFDRLNYRTNLDFNITPTTRFSTNLAGFFSTQRRPRSGLSNESWFTLYGMPPDIFPLRYSDGTYGDWDIDNRFANQVTEANFSGYRLEKVTQVNTDFALNQKLDFITKGLAFNAKLSYDITSTTSGPNVVDRGVLTKYISPEIIYEIVPGMTEEELKALEENYTTYKVPDDWTKSEAGKAGYDFVNQPYSFGTESANSNIFRSLNYELSLNYNRDFGKNSVTGLFLVSRNERARGSVFPSYREDWVGRLVYNYDRRYILELNGAYNGSEKFARKNRFGFFPSLALGWVVSNEQFFEKFTPVVNTLKFRYSNGKVGSDAGIDRWLYVAGYDVTNTTWQFGNPYITNSTYPYNLEGVIPNPDIQWEEAKKIDYGVEAGLFKNLIKLSFDYFQEDRTKIFVAANQRVIPDYFGAPPVAGNIGHVKNEGWELEAELSKTTPKGLKYSISCAWAYVKDEVIYKADPQLAPDYQKQAGFAIGQPRSALNQEIMNSWNDVYTGVLTQSNTYILPGDFHMIDFNSDGVVNNLDAVPYGYADRPQYTYMPRISIDYKGLRFNLGFYGVYNLKGENDFGNLMGPYQFQQSLLYPWRKEGSWGPELGNGADSKYPGMRFLSDPSFGMLEKSMAAFRLQTASISYNLKAPFLKTMGVSGVRFNLTGDNLYTWTDANLDIDSDRGVAVNRTYPRLKRITIGMSLNF
jgi:TonB-linked SusC/RagA family outer membrane protein